MTHSEWLSRKELADRWGLPVATLAQWGSQNRGPRYAIFGRHCRYRLADITEWEDAQFSDDQTQPAAEPDEHQQCDAGYAASVTPRGP